MDTVKRSLKRIFLGTDLDRMVRAAFHNLSCAGRTSGCRGFTFTTMRVVRDRESSGPQQGGRTTPEGPGWSPNKPLMRMAKADKCRSREGKAPKNLASSVSFPTPVSPAGDSLARAAGRSFEGGSTESRRAPTELGRLRKGVTRLCGGTGITQSTQSRSSARPAFSFL